MSYCSHLLSMQILSTSLASRSSFRDPGMRASVTLIIHEAAFYVVLHVFWCFINVMFNNTFKLYAWRIYEFHVHTKLLCKCHYYACRYGHTVKLLSLTENEYDALQLFYVRNPTVTGYWFSLLHDVNESKPSLYFICKLHLIKVEGWCSERMHLTERSDVLLSRKERNGLQR